jgi:RHS repeat-associated protein
MKYIVNLFLAFVFLFNEVFFSQITIKSSQSAAPVASPTNSPTGTPTPGSSFDAYPPPNMPTPTPTPTSTPTPTLPPILPTPTPTPTTPPEEPEDHQPFKISAYPDFLPRNKVIQMNWKLGKESVNLSSGLSLDLRNAENPSISLVRQPVSSVQGEVNLTLSQGCDSGCTLLADLKKDNLAITSQEVHIGKAEQFNVTRAGDEITTRDGAIKVKIGDKSLNRDATFYIFDQGNFPFATNSIGIHPFEIVAEGTNDFQKINRFPVSIQIECKYDQEEFAGKEDSLRMKYFDESTHRWEFMASYADPTTGYLIGLSDHLTLFDVTSTTLQGYKIPDLSNLNVNAASGAATYSYPIEVPAGPAGLTPSLTLTYNSQIVDSSSYRTQSSWVGMGFELEAGSIARNTKGTDADLTDDTFALNLNGGSWLLVPYYKNTSPAYEDYYTENANFMRIRRFLHRDKPGQDYDSDLSYWEVWDKSGNQYFFGETDLSRAYYAHYFSGPEYTWVSLETWEWALSRSSNIFGQQLTYAYDRILASREASGCLDTCEPWDQVISIYLREIDYPNNIYRVLFERQARLDFDSQCRDKFARCANDEERLSDIKIQSNPDGNSNFSSAVTVRKYQFNYNIDGNGDEIPVIFPNVTWIYDIFNCQPTSSDCGLTTTLMSIKEYGYNNETSGLPPTTFTYGDGMHLTNVINGYNGKVVFVYQGQTSETSDPTPWPLPDTTGVQAGNPSYISGGVNGTSTSLGSQKYFNIMPGGMYWISANIKASTGTTINFRLHGYNDPNKPANLDTTVIVPANNNNIAADYSVKVKMPIFAYAWTSSDPGYSTALYVGIDCWHCTIYGISYGPMVTRYLVSEKHVYPNASQETYNNYQYIYSGTNVNTVDLAVESPGYDPEIDFNWKLFHLPYSEYRGNQMVTEIFPDGHKTISKFYQTDTLQMQPHYFETYDSSDQLLAKTIYTYNQSFLPIDSSAQPDLATCKQPVHPHSVEIPCKDIRIFWTDIKNIENQNYASNGIDYIATMIEYYYDTVNNIPTYGNLLRAVNKEWLAGNWVSHDMQVTAYNPNPPTSSLYLVGLPGSQKTYQCGSACTEAGNPAIAELLSETDYLYDNNTNPNTFPAPSAGKLTAKRTLLRFAGSENSDPRYLDQTFGYDSYGNVNTSTVFKGEGTSTTLAADIQGSDPETTTACYGNYPTNPNSPTCTDDLYGSFLGWVKTTPDNVNYQVTYYEYDKGRGLLTKETDPNGAIAQAGHDAFGRMSAVAKPGDDLNSPTLQVFYNDGAPFWVETWQKVDSSQISKARIFYDGLGQKIRTQTLNATLADGTCDTLDSIPDTCDITTDFRQGYEAEVSITKQTAPYAVLAGTLDPLVDPPAGKQLWTVTLLDALGRPSQTNKPDDTFEKINYEVVTFNLLGQNRLLLDTQIIDANHSGDANPPSTHTYSDGAGRTVAVVPPEGPYTVYGYDGLDRLTQVQQVENGGSSVFATSAMTYDLAGRKKTMSDPDMGNWTYNYDALGNLVIQTDARNCTTTLAYDLFNRLTGKSYSGCPATVADTAAVTYTYDQGPYGIGRRTAMQVGDASAHNGSIWTYDDRGRMASESKTTPNGITYTTSYTYNSADQVTSMAYPSGELVDYGYNPQGQISSVYADEWNSSYYLSGATYDAAGRVIELDFGNNTKTINTFNPWTTQGGNLQSLQSGSLDSFPTSPDLQGLSYTYDANGNIKTISDARNSDQKQCFDYDTLNRLTGATTTNDAVLGCTANVGNGNYDETYSYDPDTGNLSSKTGVGTYVYSTSHPHAVTKMTTDTTDKYGYDANGNMISRATSTGNFGMKYDAENRLVEVRKENVLFAGYVYDGDGNRVLAIDYSLNLNNPDKTVYIGNYFEVFIDAEFTSPVPPDPCPLCTYKIYIPFVIDQSPAPQSGQIWRSYFYAASKRLAMRVRDNASGTTSGVFWLYGDQLGSTSVSAKADGTPKSSITYKPWGETRSGGLAETTFHYTGQRQESGLGGADGLYFYNARWYDPSIMRWIQPDTVIPDLYNPLDYDRYAYVRNSPVNFNDPSGHCPICFEIAIELLSWLIDRDMSDGSFDTPNDIRTTVDATVSVIAGNPFGDARDTKLVSAISSQADSSAPDVTNWLVGTMNSNANGSIASTLRNANAGGPGDSVGANLAWIGLVKSGGPWDYKVEFNSASVHQVTLGGKTLGYDVVANIHYGFVGAASGFSEDWLSFGAGIAQIKDGTSNLAYVTSWFDDPRDNAAIMFGYFLFQKYGGNLTKEQFEAELKGYEKKMEGGE